VTDLFAIASAALAGLGLVYWGAQWVVLLRVARSVPLLDQLPQQPRSHWPRVSAIVTACNEEATLEQAVRARFAEDYPDLELILVEDRSTDSTPDIARRLALEDPRLKVVHLRELPDGWLGKVHAMQRGLEQATGEWLLFSDGDVSAHRGVLGRLVDYCERRGLDHCTVLPRLRPVNPLLDCLSSVFMRLVALNLRLWAIEDPSSKASVGIGAFNMVRRAAFERSPGFEWLRLEVADDLCLGEMLKASGARQSVVNGRALVDLEFHSSVGDALRSSERATFTAVGNFSLARLVVMAAAVMGLELSPLLSLALARAPVTFAAGFAALAVAVAAQLAANRFNGRSSGNLVLLPLAELLSGYSMVRAGVLGTWRGGIRWRGTFYSSKQLKAGRRFGTAFRTLKSRDPHASTSSA
jgi:hypothetical protein